MGDNDVEKAIKKTQDSLGKFVKKPPLSDKLLKKPPFRFLHDVFTAVIRNTGFMKGLYIDSEVNSDAIKDKDAKIAFLQKTVDFVGMAVGKKLSVKPTKIVAGHEPEKTNELLATIAEAINKKVDNDSLVKKFLGGGESNDKKSRKDKDKDRESSSDKRRRDKDREERKGSADRNKRSESKDREKKDHNRDKKDRDASRDREKHEDKDKKEEKDRDRDKDKKERDKERRRRRDKEEDGKENREKEQPVVNGEKEDAEREPPARIPRPSSAKGSRRRHRDDEEDFDKAKEQKKQEAESGGGTMGDDDLPPQVLAARKLARPSSARPAAPKVKSKDRGHEEQAAPIGSSNVPNLIVDSKDSEDEDDFITKEEEPGTLPVDEPPPQDNDAEEDGDHGGLVKKILETKKELEGGSQKAQTKKTDKIEKPLVSDAARRKEREMVQREIDKLRTSIQTLTRSANPLGKIMDYVQEDLDSMQKELEMWKKENKENTMSLKQEQSITESSVEPLKAQLVEIDQAIEDQLDLIAAVKCNIKKNDDKIEKMLSSVTKS